MRILLTGGLGNIGHTLANELSRRGHEVWTSDLYHSERERYVRCDIREFRQVERLLSRAKFDYVYNLAAEYGRWNGEDYYENLWLTNVVGTKHFLRMQEQLKFRLIHFSSAEVYGDYEGVMAESVMDTVPIKQMNDYAMTKWVNEMQVLNSATMFGTESVRVRPVNVYGPGEIYTPYRGVIPTFIYKALTGQPYTVFLGHKRIFDYVEDTCRTLANIVDNFRPGEVYNLGGRPEWECEIKRVSDIVLNCLGLDDSKVTYKEAEPFTTKVKTIDSSKAIRDLKHNPIVPIEVGLPKTIEWMKEHYKAAIPRSR
jgi:dTDP-glucose 4,6-dehydratase